MDPKQKLVMAAVALLLLWWLTRPQAASAATADGSVTPGPNPLSPPSAAVAAVAVAPTVIIAQPYAPPEIDVAGDVSDGESDVLVENDGLGVFRWDQAMQLYRQLWLPASKLPLSNLSPQDWIYAKTFLENGGNPFVRRDDLGMLGRNMLADASQQRGGSLAASIIGTVASIIPIVGAGFNAAMQSTAQTVGGSAEWNAAMGDGRMGATIRSQLMQPTQQTRHLLSNYADRGTWGSNDLGEPLDGPEAPLDRFVMGLPEQVGMMAAQNFHPTNPVFSVHDGFYNYRDVKFRLRLRLFSRYAGGWVLPWLSWHFNGDQALTLISQRQRTNRRARILRAVDAMICQYAPFKRENPPFGHWADATPSSHYPTTAVPRRQGSGDESFDEATVFYYVNPMLGPMMGSIFPPTSEDKRYVGTDGREYSFYGEPRNKFPSTLSIGPIDDDLVDPPKVWNRRHNPM